MANILLGVSGGIAAYKALEFVRLASEVGHAVRVVQTRSSLQFVGRASFQALSGAPVLVSEFELDPARGAFPGQRPPEDQPIGHLALAENADVMLVAPASANTIGKLAHGRAEDMLSSCALALQRPLILAPAMNSRMYEHPATRANIETLSSRGAIVLQPGEGRLASKGEHGLGRLPEASALLAACEAHLPGAPAPWAGINVLITAGGTREPIDGVRYLGNRSSGRMGIALAEAALARGAQVTIVTANVSLPRPPAARWVQAGTAAEMLAACERELPGSDVLLMAAAVADFRPAAQVDGKIKKAGRQSLTLQLEATADVLSSLAASRRESQTIVGFAAEHGEQAARADRSKLTGKALDAIVINDVSRPDIGFDAQENEVDIVSESWETHVAKASKREVAESILDAVARLRDERSDRR